MLDTRSEIRGNVNLTTLVYRHPNCSSTQQCASLLCTREALYGGRTEAMRLHYKSREVETFRYVGLMILYPYICKYFKFPVGHPVIHVGDAFKDKEACLRMDSLIKCSIVPPDRFIIPCSPSEQSETHDLSVPNLRPNPQYR